MSGDVLRTLTWVFCGNGLFLLAYTALRVEHLVWNRATLWQFAGSDIARAFPHGLRFDASAVFTLSALPLLLALAPVPARMRRRRRLLAAAVFFGLQAPFIALNVVDLELAHFVGHRATRDTLLLAREVQGKFLAFFLPYLKLWVANTALLACLGPPS